MKSPVMIKVAEGTDTPAYIALNRRPGAPVPQRVKEFLLFALSRDGQAIVARDPATDENVQEPQEMTFGLAVRFEFIQELPQGACIHSGPPASDWAFIAQL